ncbi:MAG: tetratricopeptide repeat protein [Gammaproteobacteria bacterium]|nr:tetratricopeptide repeat protein [Gammaproteobacteria bacterium]
MNTPLPLVRLKGEPASLPAVDLALDPHMAIHGHTSLMLRHVYDVDSALHYLGHRIVNHPRELRSHVQRILLLIRQGDGASLYGALVDLLITLGDKGLALKQRMLDLAAPLLSRTSLMFLQRQLESGIRACDPAIGRVRGSLLRAEFCDTDQLVLRHKTQESVQKRTPLEEARELVEYGQLEQALETLENALLMDPDQPEVATELLELYIRMGELDRMEAMREQMLINFGRVPENWPAAAS